MRERRRGSCSATKQHKPTTSGAGFPPSPPEENPDSGVVQLRRRGLSAADRSLFAVNTVSVSRSRSALHHLGSQYSGIRCVRGDSGCGCICSGCQDGVRGCRVDSFTQLQSSNVQPGNLCSYGCFFLSFNAIKYTLTEDERAALGVSKI